MRKCLGEIDCLDVTKYILVLDYSSFPVQYKISGLQEFWRNMSRDIGTDQASNFLESAMSTGTYRIACFIRFAGTKLAGTNYSIVTYCDLDKGWLKTGPELPYGRKRLLPRPQLDIGDGTELFEPSSDIVDYALSFAGSNFEEFWSVDIDNILFQILLEQPPPPVVGIYRGGLI